MILVSLNVMANEYYLSSSTGSDDNDGISNDSPWKSLDRLNNIDLKPGDKILLRSGDFFTGSISIDIQGGISNPLVISNYGEGRKPVLDGNGAEEVIFLKNPANIIVENLEIVNWKGVYGIRFVAEDAGEMRNLTLQNLDIHDVGSAMFETTNPSKTKGAISGRVYKGKQPSWWNGLAIKNVYIHNVGSCAITFGNQVNLYKLQKEDIYYKTHQNVIIEHCRIDSTAHDGIWIRQSGGAIIQHNIVSRTGLNGISNGIWLWDCFNSVIQYNEGYECLSPRGNDGAPFSIDNHCWNCTIQYNYSHDNEGPGYMLFGRMGDNGGNTIRYNVSYNDNVTRTYKAGTACITACSEVKNAVVENNIVIAGPETHNILGHRNWEGYPHSVTYRNNLFVGNGKAIVAEDKAVWDAGIFENNFFINVPNIPDELKNEKGYKGFFDHMKMMDEIINQTNK